VETLSAAYQDARKWADAYKPQQRQIATGLLIEKNLISVVFTEPTYREDAANGIDDYIDIERMKVAYRVRKFEHFEYWKQGFTLRTSSKYGYPSELEKVMQQKVDYADWLLYSVADQHEPGELMTSALIDLKSVGAQLVQYPEILAEAYRNDYFIDLPYAAFPEHVVMGIH
jgi:hypothetical protein